MFETNQIYKKQWQLWKYEDEYNFARDVVVPFLVRRAKNGTFMDLGHYNIYYIDALIDYLAHETNYEVLVIRIRRERYQTAVSLSYNNPKEMFSDICDMAVRYCPRDRIEDVMISVPETIWVNMSIFQQVCF